MHISIWQSIAVVGVFVSCLLSFLSDGTWWNSRQLWVSTTTTGDTFQGIPLTYHDDLPLDSTVHCIGQTFGAHPDPRRWLYRSCEFRNLCYDMQAQDFVLFPSQQEQALAAMVASNPLVTVSSLAEPENALSLGAVDPPDPKESYESNLKALEKELLWFPEVRNQKKSKGYYQLPDSVILVPFRETIPVTEVSIVRKDFLSIFALLASFGLEQKQLVLVRQGKSRCGGAACEALFAQQLPKMGVSFAALDPSIQGEKSHLICGKYGAAGLGMLMTGSKPVRDKDGSWVYTHTVGRDETFRMFEEHIAANLAKATTR